MNNDLEKIEKEIGDAISLEDFEKIYKIMINQFDTIIISLEHEIKQVLDDSLENLDIFHVELKESFDNFLRNVFLETAKIYDEKKFKRIGFFHNLYKKIIKIKDDKSNQRLFYLAFFYGFLLKGVEKLELDMKTGYSNRRPFWFPIFFRSQEGSRSLLDEWYANFHEQIKYLEESITQDFVENTENYEDKGGIVPSFMGSFRIVIKIFEDGYKYEFAKKALRKGINIGILSPKAYSREKSDGNFGDLILQSWLLSMYMRLFLKKNRRKYWLDLWSKKKTVKHGILNNVLTNLEKA